MITMIPCSKLEPHPDNPRKELGDLSELAASIRRQGLLQNLTVVPSPDSPDKYRIVIGHRRFSASGIAGLDELPCIIDTKMTYPEQIAVMMSENIQRNDLTITERVGGIQMMMDLGMNVGEISGNTGISDTTIRRYAKLAKLNKGGMVQAEQRGATLMQFAEITEIEDDALRQEALEKVGTDEYRSVMYRVRAWRDRKARLPHMVEKLNAFATEIKKADYSKHIWNQNFYYYDSDVLTKVDEIKRKKGTAYAYIIKDSNVELYEERSKHDDAKEQAKREAQERMKARANHEREIAAAFKQMRSEFMKGLSLKRHETDALRFVIWDLTRREYQYCPTTHGCFAEVFLHSETKEGGNGSIQIDNDAIFQFPEKRLLLGAVLAAYDRIDVGDMSMLDRYSGKPKENTATIRELYDHMECMGYNVSQEERDWLDGCHECFTFPHDEKENTK